MIRKSGEIMLNTPEQVRAWLGEALAIVDELEPPEDLRETCFGKAVDLVAAKQVMVEQMHAGGVVLPQGGQG